MTTFDLFVIIIAAALIHASFQLSVSVLTLLSSHTLGAKRSQARLLRLTSSFASGVGVMTALLLAATAFTVSVFARHGIDPVLWVAACGLLFGLGFAVWVFYFRRDNGTTLWIPRGMARYLEGRTKATSLSAEAFGLGLGSVLGEILFVVGPTLVAALALVQLPSEFQLAAIALYTVLSMLSLLIVHVLVSGGHKISKIQRWREDNKNFLQFAAGSAMIALGFYIYVDHVLTHAVLAAAGGV
ncbi:TPA: hypothetical protein DIV49_04095 [Candidatus Saccharibacteria bacterium]|mgnify:CR=1 FL=1|nr:hypothetical protein [Candidatus Saccharibacteria bacterium]HRJ90592.1 hypothetical protein [Candidatus Saccharibacteria bacterium]